MHFDQAIMRSTRILTTMFVCLTSLLFFPTVSKSQSDVPRPEMLDAIFPVLRHILPPPPPLKVSLVRPTEQPEKSACGLVPLNLVETRGRDTSIFKILGTPASEQTNQPVEFLIKLQRLTVDADGSPRAYHPEDPFGRGVCDRSPTHGQATGNICALDNLGNAGIRLFQGSQRITLYSKAGADQHSEPNPDFTSVWGTLWAQIAKRQPQWVDLDALFGNAAPSNLRLYYSKDSNAAVIFDTDIIPFKDSYPCQSGAGSGHGYFVAATAPLPKAKSDLKQDACSAASYLDPSRVPFFVLPGGVFQNLHVGDVAVAIAKVNDADRLVFGMVGDIGPEDQIGEGSILLARELLGTVPEPKNSIDLGNLDIKVQNTSSAVSSLAILVLGGTAKYLAGNYTAKNIEKVGQTLLSKWANDLPDRLEVCADAATANPLNGFQQPGPN